MKKLSDKEYIEEGGSRCPYCYSTNLNKDNWDGNTFVEEVFCNECGKGWFDCYSLVGYLEKK